ncbi:MAG: hypothetical protein V1918_01995 [Planctomycetota bacterium]
MDVSVAEKYLKPFEEKSRRVISMEASSVCLAKSGEVRYVHGIGSCPIFAAHWGEGRFPTLFQRISKYFRPFRKGKNSFPCRFFVCSKNRLFLRRVSYFSS